MISLLAPNSEIVKFDGIFSHHRGDVLLSVSMVMTDEVLYQNYAASVS